MSHPRHPLAQGQDRRSEFRLQSAHLQGQTSEAVEGQQVVDLVAEQEARQGGVELGERRTVDIITSAFERLVIERGSTHAK